MKHLLAIIAIAASGAAGGSPLIEPLRPNDEVQGCGCSFHVPPNARDAGKAVVQWEVGESARLRMDGKLHLLRVGVGGNDVMDYKGARVGQQRRVELHGEGVSVVANCVVSEVCSEAEGGCEAVAYRASLAIKGLSGRTEVEAWASCGC